MQSIINYTGFVIASIALAMTPGSDSIYLLTRTITQGRMAGLASLAGITLGLLVHITAVALGLAQVIARSPTAFMLVQYGGAMYLVYLGVQMWRSPPLEFSGSLKTEKPYFQLFKQGLITNLLNPKVLLFFLTLLPQFVRTDATHSALPFFILGITAVVVGTIWNAGLVFAAAPLGNLLRRKPKISQIMHRVSGTIFMALAAKLVLPSK